MSADDSTIQERMKIEPNLSGAKYIKLLFSIRNEVRFISFVLRDTMHKTETINKFLLKYSKSLLESKKTKSWPGTTLPNKEEATIYYFRMSDDMWDEILKVNSFKAWVYPMRLEDPCFYDTNKSLLLGTASHENRVFYP